jgi:hypothetical protein
VTSEGGATLSGRVPPFPELRGNFVQFPEAVLDLLLRSDLSREELLVTLYLGRITYAFDHDHTFIGLEAIARGVSLSPSATEEALNKAIERGTVLPFTTEGDGRFFLLNTVANLGVASVVDETTSPSVQIAPGVSEKIEPSVPTEARDSSLRELPEARVSDTSFLRGVPKKVLEKIVSIIGRELTRDETERLGDLKASDDHLMKAIENLMSKHVEIYSSDQVVYEYESIVSAEKRKAEELRRRGHAEEKKQRSRNCRKCSGLGYIFIGINTIKECDCRKG